MKYIRLVLVLMMIAALVGGHPRSVRADATIVPDDDTFVRDKVGDRDTNFDQDTEELHVTAEGFPTGVPVDIAYLRFSVSGISGSTVDAVTLRLYGQYSAPGMEIAVFSTDSDDWNGGAEGIGDQTTLTFTNAPGQVDQLDSAVTSSGVPGWWEFGGPELAAYVQDQLPDNGGDGYITLRVMALSANIADIQSFEDRENGGGTGNYPQLVMEGEVVETIYPFGDLDHDCDVDVVDIMIVATRWNAQTGDPDYDPAYDFDDDGDIDVADIMAVAAEWGATCSGMDPGVVLSPLISGGTALMLLPANALILPGGTITYTLMINGAENLGAYQMAVEWDPSAVTMESMEPLAILDEGGNTVVDLGPLEGEGRLTFGAYSFGVEPGASGDGALALLTFRKLSEEDTVISLGNVQLVDMEGQEISPGSVTGAVLGLPNTYLYLPLILK